VHLKQRPTVINFADLADPWNWGKEKAKKSLAERWRHCLPERHFLPQIFLPYTFLAGAAPPAGLRELLSQAVRPLALLNCPCRRSARKPVAATRPAIQSSIPTA
jgi:hypothetical protein